MIFNNKFMMMIIMIALLAAPILRKCMLLVCNYYLLFAHD